MENKKTLFAQLVSLLLLVALMFPSGVKIFHAIDDDHHHTVCTETATHIHVDAEHCEICHFQFVSFNFEIPQYPDFSEPNIPAKVEKHFFSTIFRSVKLTNRQLRAPPTFLG